MAVTKYSKNQKRPKCNYSTAFFCFQFCCIFIFVFMYSFVLKIKVIRITLICDSLGGQFTNMTIIAHKLSDDQLAQQL